MKASLEDDLWDMEHIQHLAGEPPAPDIEFIKQDSKLINLKFENPENKSVYHLVILSNKLALAFGCSENVLV